MQLRKFMIATAALAVLALGQSTAQAGYTGGFANFAGSLPFSTALGTITTNTGNINTATMFTLPGFNYTGGGSGDFSANLTPSYTTIVNPFAIMGLNPNAPVNVLQTFGGFSMGTTAFGFFDTTQYEVQSTGSMTQAYYFLGTFTTGTDFMSDSNAGSGPASLILSFTQTGSSISVSASLGVPPVATPSVPEPASVVMLGLGLAGFGGVALRRRMAK